MCSCTAFDSRTFFGAQPHTLNKSPTDISKKGFLPATGHSGGDYVLSCDSLIFCWKSQHINVRAFQPLNNLRSLHISDVARDDIQYLCDTLAAIDVINMDKYDVSCYQLSLGSSFEDSTIKPAFVSEEPANDTLNGSAYLNEENRLLILR